ncbi:MAG: hypothetical protein ACI4W0_01115 [Bacilli bacterium]
MKEKSTISILFLVSLLQMKIIKLLAHALDCMVLKKDKLYLGLEILGRLLLEKIMVRRFYLMEIIAF